jgi:hypothetical protein
MRQSALALVCLCLAPISFAAHAEDAGAPAAADGAPAESPAAASQQVRALSMGPSATNPAGQSGHVHTVAPGETLWDVSEAYLGTPWVWPSIWKDEGRSGSDAQISAGDVLWVSETEIRRLTPAEVKELHVTAPAAMPAAMGDATEPGGMHIGDAQGLDRWTSVQAMGFLARGSFGAVGEVIGNPTNRAALGTGDDIYIDLGSAQVSVGDRLRVVRTRLDIPDPDSGQLIGTFVEPLGWARVTVVEGEASKAVLEGAVSEINAGDLLLRSEGGDPATKLTLQSTPASVTGDIVHMVGERVISGGMDVVYLDRGTEAGLAPGSVLDVVRPGGMHFDERRGRDVKVPDTTIGQLVVITANPANAAAYVMHATTDLVRGDFYRGAEAP